MGRRKKNTVDKRNSNNKERKKGMYIRLRSPFQSYNNIVKNGKVTGRKGGLRIVGKNNKEKTCTGSTHVSQDTRLSLG